jgi:NlpC/P60 family/Bacterial dipeptidyl-peptidase Sh3 domain
MNNLLKMSANGEYICEINLDFYDSFLCKELATQGKKGRHLTILAQESTAIKVSFCEDKYIAWLPLENIKYLQPTREIYQSQSISRPEIELKISEIINFTQQAKLQDNHYLWGGNIGPNFDCSGLIQAAFSAFNIWLPRDSYQQADFTIKINQSELLPGDLIFFATKKTRINHVALYLGNNEYIHSSGQENGRNGIGIDKIIDDGDPVTHFYCQSICQFGRVMHSL